MEFILIDLLFLLLNKVILVKLLHSANIKLILVALSISKLDKSKYSKEVQL